MLNATYEPLSVVPSRRAACLVLADKADIVEDGVTGILVTPGEVEPLAAGLRRLIDDPDLRSRYADAARRRTEAKFAIETTVSRYADLFRSLTPKEGGR